MIRAHRWQSGRLSLAYTGNFYFLPFYFWMMSGVRMLPFPLTDTAVVTVYFLVGLPDEIRKARLFQKS